MKVSVVVPFYNSEKTLKDCIDSIFGQVHEDLEVLLIDDCSTDQSPAIAKQFHGVTYFRLPKKSGEAGARQKGLDLAEGEIVLQCDSDAWYPPNFISKMVRKLKESKGAIGVEQGLIFPIRTTQSLAYFHAYYKRKASFTLKLSGKKKPYGGTMYYAKAKNHARYKPLKIGTDTEFVADLKKNFYFAFCEEAFFLHHDPSDFKKLYQRVSFHYHHVPQNSIPYICKRFASAFFPWLFVLWGERFTQYLLALQDRSAEGIAGIFIGNFLTDLSSIHYFKRWFSW